MLEAPNKELLSITEGSRLDAIQFLFRLAQGTHITCSEILAKTKVAQNHLTH